MLYTTHLMPFEGKRTETCDSSSSAHTNTHSCSLSLPFNEQKYFHNQKSFQVLNVWLVSFFFCNKNQLTDGRSDGRTDTHKTKNLIFVCHTLELKLLHNNFIHKLMSLVHSLLLYSSILLLRKFAIWFLCSRFNCLSTHASICLFLVVCEHPL